MKSDINIAELLKDCPKGMELDCLIYDKLYFKCVREHRIYPIVCYTIDNKGNEHEVSFNWYGKYAVLDTAKCVIYPKGSTTWENFHRPFVDGDILVHTQNDRNVISIYNSELSDEDEFKVLLCHAILWDRDEGLCTQKTEIACYDEHVRFATEVEKQRLFEAIKDNGYRWNADTKTLEKLAEPVFKDGDILFVEATFNWVLVNKESEDKGNLYKYVAIPYRTNYTYITYDDNPLCRKEDVSKIRFATEEEKQKLFQVIKENGYKWDEETKTLEKLIVPKFKVGDRIKLKNSPSNIISTVTKINDDGSISVNDYEWTIKHELQDEYELVTDKFDIATLKPFDRVLVRLDKANQWYASWFSHVDERLESFCRPYVTVSGKSYTQMIPYEGNEHLLGTTNDCADFYKIGKYD